MVSIPSADEGSHLSPDSSGATMAVVTITVCLADPRTIGPPSKVSSHDDLSRLLSNLDYAIAKNYGGDLIAGEVLWAPEVEDEVLTKEEVASRYPNLKPLLQPRKEATDGKSVLLLR